jgi:hypothetical protein
LDRDLKEEKAWAETVRDKLLARAKMMSPIGRCRVERHVEWYMKAVAIPPPDEAKS